MFISKLLQIFLSPLNQDPNSINTDNTTEPQIVTKLEKIIYGLTLHKHKIQNLINLIDCILCYSEIINSLVGFIKQRQVSIEDCFIYLRLDSIIIQFILSQFEYIAVEMSVTQFTKFLKQFLNYLEEYFDENHYYEGISILEKSQTEDDSDQETNSKKTFKGRFLKKRKFLKLQERLNIWISMMDLVSTSGLIIRLLDINTQ